VATAGAFSLPNTKKLVAEALKSRQAFLSQQAMEDCPLFDAAVLQDVLPSALIDCALTGEWGISIVACPSPFHV
jgi:hypothetical protein